MYNKYLILIFAFLGTLIITTPAFCQRSVKTGKAGQEFAKGIDLLSKEKYGAAQHAFDNVLRMDGGAGSFMKADAEYYSAICAIELFNKDAEYLITNFIAENPGNPHTKSAYFEMGKFQFRKKKYRSTIKWLNRVDKYELDNEELGEYYFKLGYSYFVKENYKKASTAFFEIKDTDNRYKSPAIYYYSHIEYINKNYETALQGFLQLSEDELFAPIVPYYISQIYYLQNKYDLVIAYAPSLLDHATTKRAPEIARIIGESYYRTSKYKEALPYLEMYREKSQSFTREDLYELGYAYYRTNDYDKAGEAFRNVTNVDDDISQNAFYHLADCYLKLDKKNDARLAFESAARLEFDKTIQEDALYNYAKLSYELSFSPFNEAVKAFNKYINLYPGSDRLDEAYTYLGKVYLSTKNYKDALASLEQIKNINTNELKMAYQRVAYFRGLELCIDLEFEEAVKHFDKSLNNSKYNKTIKALSYYWRGESYYKLARFDDAINSYNEFLLTDGAFELQEYMLAHYNLGYSFFKKKDYDEAISWFRKFLSYLETKKSKVIGDTYIRIADCYFVQTKYEDAIDYYDKAVGLHADDSDYAMFQKGFSRGLLNEHNQKIIILNQLMTDYPESQYVDDALFELGSSYVTIDAPEMAESSYQIIIDNHGNSSYVKNALLQLGLICYNQDKNDEAIKIYKRVIADYPGTKESKNALAGLKNIYVDISDVETYFDYAKSLGEFADISLSEQDSLTYIAAEKIYMDGDCERSGEMFSRYIDKFKEGTYILNAHFYKADCSYKAGSTEDALGSYNFVISRPKNMFTEPALLRAARLNYKQENYQEALTCYIKLGKVAEVKSNVSESLTGQMRCNYHLGKYDDAVNAANNILIGEKIPDELFRESHYILAQSYLNKNDPESALRKFKVIAKDVKSREGAEAKYMVADLLFKKKEYALAENEVIDFIDKNTPQQYWLAKAFLLWADIYEVDNQNYQAKQTLQSVIDNYDNDNDGIKEQAEEKLLAIKEREEAEKMLLEVLEEIEVNLNINDKHDRLLEEKTGNQQKEEKSIEQGLKEEMIEQPDTNKTE